MGGFCILGIDGSNFVGSRKVGENIICLLVMNSQLFPWKPVPAYVKLSENGWSGLWPSLLSGLEAQQWGSHVMVNSGHGHTSVILYPLQTPQSKVFK